MSHTTPTLRILVYSNDSEIRQQVITALGNQLHPDLPELQYIEVATEPVVIRQMDTKTIDLAILDGEAAPAGGMGICRQLKNEVAPCPPIIVLTGRPDDRWLARWSDADAALPYPINPIVLSRTVINLLRPRYGMKTH